MALLIGFFFLSIIASFFCSIWEAVLLSVTPSYIQRKESEGTPAGLLLAELKRDIDRPLAAILTLNTIAHTVGAIGVGAQAGKLFGDRSIDIFGFGLTFESVVATVMTLAVLFLSEIIPKTIGANKWRTLAPFTARSLKLLMLVLKPLVWVSTKLTKMLKKKSVKSVFSKQDFAAMAQLIRDTGGLEMSDYTLIKNVLQFDELKAENIMTPRSVVVMFNEDRNLKEVYDERKKIAFSRLPVYSGKSDNVTGLILRDEWLQHIIDGNGQQPLASIKREVSTVSASTSIRTVFALLRDKREHMAVVVDQYGTLAGLVTLEDIIETLLGLEIMDETDSVEDLQKFARSKWEERAKKIGLIEE